MMTKDTHLISEAYLSSKKKLVEQAPQAPAAGAPAAPAPQAQQPAAMSPQDVQTKLNTVAQQAQQPTAPAPKASKEQEKAVNDLLKAFGLPATAAPYLLQSLIQNVPALKQQYGM